MFKIEVIIRVVNKYGDVVDPKGNPAMMSSEHQQVHAYPAAFATAAGAYAELQGMHPEQVS